MKPATEAEFFARMNPLDVHPRVDVSTLRGRFHTSHWETRERVCLGTSVSDSHSVDPTRYSLTASSTGPLQHRAR